VIESFVAGKSPDRLCEDVVVVTDDFAEVLPTLAESERRLRQLLAEDPTGTGPLWRIGKTLRPGYDSMDDRAWLRLSVPAAPEAASPLHA
jgi:hypothetical protein